MIVKAGANGAKVLYRAVSAPRADLDEESNLKERVLAPGEDFDTTGLDVVRVYDLSADGGEVLRQEDTQGGPN